MNIFFNILASSGGQISVGEPSEPTGEKVMLLSDHSYSWWVHPQSVYKDGVNYFTSIGIDGNAYIHKYDGISVTSVMVRTFSQVDEHNAPSFMLRDNDIYICSHPRNSTNFIAKTLSYDFQNLSSEILINNTAQFTSANYSQLYIYEDRMFLFCREEGGSWGVTWSDDGGITYAARKLLATGFRDKLYLNGIQDNNRIVFGVYNNPVSRTDNHLGSFELDLVTGYTYVNGQPVMSANQPGVTLSIYGLWSPRPTEPFTKLFLPTLGAMRFLDIAFSQDKQTVYALCIDIQSDYVNGKYYLVKWNRADNTGIVQIEIIDTGKDTNPTYYGGAYFVQDLDHRWNGDIYLAREASAVWYVERWHYNGTTISKVQDIDQLNETAAGLSLTRPQPPKGSMNGGLQVIYQKGDYNESFTEWDNELIGIL